MGRREAELDAKERALFEFLCDAIQASIDPREARRRGPEAIEEIALAAIPLVERRQHGETRVRVYNPGGPRGGRTVVEVLAADQPFLVDTSRLCLERLSQREPRIFHPLLPLEREDDGSIARMGRDSVRQARESYIYAEIARADDSRLDDIQREITSAMQSVRDVVSDHAAMVERIREHIERTRIAEQALSEESERVKNMVGFLEWLADDYFVFLGYRRYDAEHREGHWRVALDPSSGLGLMRDPQSSRFQHGAGAPDVPPLVVSRLEDERLIFFDKSRNESTIHRHGRLDSISIKELDSTGKVCGFGRFIGLLTNKALRQRPSAIPILGRRCDLVLKALGTEPRTHLHKASVAAFDSLPVEFLFQFELADVVRAVERVVASEELRKLEVFAVPDPRNRSFFVSVILPRRRYHEDLRQQLHALLVDRYGATYVDHRTSFLDEEIALIHFFCSSTRDVDARTLATLERDIEERVTRWQDAFELALRECFSEVEADRLADEYVPALGEPYRVSTGPKQAAADVECLERVRRGESRLEIRFDSSPEGVRLKVLQRERPYLTDLLPVLDHFGIRVIDASATLVDGPSALSLWIVDFNIEAVPDTAMVHPALEQRLIDGLRAALSGYVEDDLFSRLILEAGLHWRSVDLIRSLMAYWAQLGNAPTKAFAAEALLRYDDATRALVELFAARFDPELQGDRSEAVQLARERLDAGRAPIQSAAEDRVYASLQNLILATLRTNLFAHSNGAACHEIAFKIDSGAVKEMPEPRPAVEIFVHSAQMSGVHLRGGRIARGGIRWSDRPLDFRREVLGLMKAQMVKNGLIVPVGSKGGFVLKRSLAEPEQLRAEAERQYARFIHALLSVTDNVVGDRTEPPVGVVRHDGDDSYLVVAPDKGTAHLPDVANEVAHETGFWLGDAFASGGSYGYDHKTEGITARGAWVSVQRHFLELGVDIQREPYTIAGIGDMSGDVFGNGMLLARRGKLVAAFNHQHIFLDPDPDPELAWRERKRIFELSRSTWKDYDPMLISEGGGVFDRGVKCISLSKRARELLDVKADQLSGEGLIRAILSMPVDLLWNGGIGTYVKGSGESHADVGDRANAPVRVDASELRVRVIGEGGNLGLTQLARVEYALAGGRINTDAVDNSGGVDLSDHEVNFKLLLERRLREGCMGAGDRNRVLRACVEDACAAVLEDSASQVRCVSMDQIRSWQDPERMALASDFLTRAADLDQAIEFLPDRETVRARASQSGTRRGYTRPEVAVLLGYTKGLVKRALIASHVPDHPTLTGLYADYFAPRLRDSFHDEILGHPLRREITATCLANRVIDRAGVTLVPELVQGLSVGIGEVIAAYHTADQLLEADRLRERIEASSLAETLRLRARLRIEDGVRLAAGVCLGLERRALFEPDDLERWRCGFRQLRELIPSCVNPVEAQEIERHAHSLVDRGVDPDLAVEIEQLQALARGFGALQLAFETSQPLRETALVHAEVGGASRISWLLARLQETDRSDGWRRVTTEALYLEMLEAQRDLTRRALQASEDTPRHEAFARDGLSPRLRQIDAIVAQIEAEGPDLPPLIVLSQQIRRLC